MESRRPASSIAWKLLKRFLPSTHNTTIIQRIALRRVPKLTFNTDRLGSIGDLDLRVLLHPDAFEEEWHRTRLEIEALAIAPDGSCNAGDRRVVYQLIRRLKLRSVLEVGTHLGGTTAYIAAALRQSAAADQGEPTRLVSVDLGDVNDPTSGAWTTYGSKCSPADAVTALGCDDFVTFTGEGSLDYLKRRDGAFDLVFLDGSHTAPMVYREVSLALNVLRPCGWILLHDYFPDLEPLWPDAEVIPGPHLAVRRMQAEGVRIQPLPLGQLPWETKLRSQISSLALLGR